MRRGSRTRRAIRDRILELHAERGLNAVQIVDVLGAEFDEVPHERTVRGILHELREAAGSTSPRWRFFDPGMAPEDARLVMDYYLEVGALPANLASRGIGFKPGGAWPRPIAADVARRFVRVRRAYPELEPRRAMRLARSGPDDEHQLAEQIAEWLTKESDR
jgi:hypothetical protein